MVPRVCFILLLLWPSVLCREIPESKNDILAKEGIETYVRQCPTGSAICINAFNIQIFGQSKMDKPEVVQVLIDIIIQYDLVLIQEIRDAAGTAIVDLLNQVNAATNDDFQMTISPRLGRSTSKEQYAYFYRPSQLQLVDTWQYPNNNPDPDADADSYTTFERPPYVVIFNAPALGHQFGMIGIHVKPDDAVAEIDALVDVYDAMSARFGENMLLCGDFNADCSYVGAGDWANIRLRNDPRFWWRIDDSVDTTVSATDCAYDRLVLAGAQLQGSFITNSAVVYNFETAMGISNELALDTSDHYPVELALM